VRPQNGCLNIYDDRRPNGDDKLAYPSCHWDNLCGHQEVGPRFYPSF